MVRSNEIFEKILKDGWSPGTYRRFLEQMRDDGHTREVARACFKGLQQDPDDIFLHGLLGQCYKELGFLSLAETEISGAVQKVEELISIYKDQAQLLAVQRRTEEACAALKKYLAHCPRDDDALKLLNELEKSGPQAQSDIPPVPVESPPPKPEAEEIFPEMATHTLAEIYITQGQQHAAIETYKELLAQDPEDQKARERLEELLAGTATEEVTQEPVLESKARNERMINVLEGWLAGIQELNRGSGYSSQN